MGYGLEAFSSSGILQVSTELLGYAVRKTVTTTTNETGRTDTTTPPYYMFGTDYQGSIITVPIEGQGYNLPIVAASIPGYSVGVIPAYYTYTPSKDVVFHTDAPSGTTINYYIFDTYTGVGTTNYGLETFNSSGQKTFTSKIAPLQMLDPVVDGSPATYSGKTLAACMLNVGDSLVTYYEGSGYLNEDGTWHGIANQVDTRTIFGGTISNSGQTITYSSSTDYSTRISSGEGDWPLFPIDIWNYAGILIPIDVTSIPLNTTFY